MTRWQRARRWSLLILAIATVWGGLSWLFWPESKITIANAEWIKVGMSLEEVEAILGGPARLEEGLKESVGYGDFGGALWQLIDGWGDSYWYYDEHVSDESFLESESWISKAVCIQVAFDSTGRVLKTRCVPVEPSTSERSFLDRCQSRIERMFGK